VLALAAVILIGGLAVPASSYQNAVLSPRDFPWLIGLLMAAAGAALLLRNASALRPGGGRSTIEEEIDVTADTDASAPAGAPDDLAAMGRAAQNPRILGLLLLLLLGYILVFVWLGYLLSTFLFLACATTLLTPRRAVRNLIYAAAFSVAVYLLFTAGLNVRLPAGLLRGLF
jgi:putative tricarboxylic transport membrane protein